MTTDSTRHPLWRRTLARVLGAELPKQSAAAANNAGDHRSATQIYLDGGGDPANERTMAILAEADRPMTPFPCPNRVSDVQDRTPSDLSPLHAHEITGDNAAPIRMMAGASFGPHATATLPSGRTITGAEMQLWLATEDEDNS